MRDTDGSRTRSSMVKMRGRATSPCTASRCCAGSICGMPAWWRSNTSPVGVMMPCTSCSGVIDELAPGSGAALRLRRTTSFSNGDGWPYGCHSTGSPGARVHGGTVSGSARAVVAAPAAAAPSNAPR
ncbi:hypothetical protein D3C72_1972270 [compost metagenome]